MEELARVRYITEQYPGLHGLSNIPSGLLCLELFLLGIGWLTVPGTFFFWSIILTIGLTIAATIFYRFVYGNTRPLRRVLLRDALFAIGLGIGLMVAFILNPLLKLHFDIAEGVLASGIFLYYWPYRRFARHYLVLAGVILCIGLLPLFSGGSDPGLGTCTFTSCAIHIDFGGHVNLFAQSVSAEVMRFLLSYAFLCILGGLGDHLLLKRATAPQQRDVQ